jgi:molybdopterin synthase catalytic subunit
MNVQVRYFALVAEITGQSEDTVELPAAATAGAALAAAAARHPRLATPGFRPLLAVNGRPAAAPTPLAEGDEVAIFPPVSGG